MADKKKIKVRDAVAVYSALRGINAAKFPTADKAGLFAVIRATRAFKAAFDSQADFERDAAERLKPEDFDALMEKRNRFDTLTPEEKREVADRLNAYDRAFVECVKPEQEKEVEIDAFEPLSEDVIAGIAAASENMALETLLLIEDACGK